VFFSPKFALNPEGVGGAVHPPDWRLSKRRAGAGWSTGLLAIRGAYVPLHATHKSQVQLLTTWCSSAPYTATSWWFLNPWYSYCRVIVLMIRKSKTS